MYSFSLNNFLLTIVGSLIIILAGHHLWNYLRDKYTVKKTKDIVNVQVEKYKKIVVELQDALDSRSQNKEFIDEYKEDLINIHKKNRQIFLLNLEVRCSHLAAIKIDYFRHSSTTIEIVLLSE
jgi:hypothetical protein